MDCTAFLVIVEDMIDIPILSFHLCLFPHLEVEWTVGTADAHRDWAPVVLRNYIGIFIDTFNRLGVLRNSWLLLHQREVAGPYVGVRFVVLCIEGSDLHCILSWQIGLLSRNLFRLLLSLMVLRAHPFVRELEF